MTTPAAGDRRTTQTLAEKSDSPPQFPPRFDSWELTVADVEREHAELRRLFDEVTAAIGPGGATAKAAKLMSRLDVQLRAHFRMEEVDGIFAQVERDAPQLARDVERLRAEHKELLIDATHLAELAPSLSNEEARRLFAHLFARFRDRVARHESEENGVLQRAYCVDVGTKD